MDRIAIIYALDEELKSMVGETRLEVSFADGEARVVQGRFRGVPVLFCRSGIGMGNAHEACGMLLERFQPTSIVSAGYCGGLKSGIRAGELLLSEEIHGGSGDRFQTDPEIRKRLALLIEEERIASHLGPLLTVVHPLRTIEEKTGAGAKGFTGVDMEAAAVAAVCKREGIPFASLKVVFDPLEMELPINDRGSLDKKAFLKLPALWRDHILCRRNLAQVLGRLITSSNGGILDLTP